MGPGDSPEGHHSHFGDSQCPVVPAVFHPRVHPIAPAIRSVRVSLTTDIAWSMASSIARLGQNWPVLAPSPSSTSTVPFSFFYRVALLLSPFLFFFLRAFERVPSSSCSYPLCPRSVQVSTPREEGSRNVYGRRAMCAARSCIWDVQRRKKQVTK